MKALVTGASSGIGEEITKYLTSLNIECIAVARNGEKLKTLKTKLNNKIEIIPADLSIKNNCIKLFNTLKSKNIDILVNCAGQGVIGKFTTTDLERELEMIDLNIKSVHILTKLFLNEMIKKDHGYILNISSIGAFINGPLISSYYASKSYVSSLTQAIDYELKKEKSKVVISCAYPGPVKTNFNKNANAYDLGNSYNSSYVAKYIIDSMFKKKKVIIPGFKIKILYLLIKILPRKVFTYFSYIQTKKKLKK